MPLPSPAADRQLKHRRTIDVQVFARGDGLWEVDATLADCDVILLSSNDGDTTAGTSYFAGSCTGIDRSSAMAIRWGAPCPAPCHPSSSATPLNFLTFVPCPSPPSLSLSTLSSKGSGSRNLTPWIRVRIPSGSPSPSKC